MSDFRSDIYSQRHEENRVFFSATDTNFEEFSHDLPSTIVPDRLFVVFEVYHRIRPDRPPSGGVPAVTECRFSLGEFYHPLERFATADAAKPAVEAMLLELELPFRLDGDESRTQLRWREGSGDDVSDASSVPLDGVGAAVARVSEFGARIVASGSGRGAPLEMRVTIRKVTVVSAERYEAMFVDYGQVSDEIRMIIHEAEERLRGLTERLSSVAAAGAAAAERLPTTFYSDYSLGFGFFEAAEAERESAAAATTEALETVVYEGDGGEANKLTCPICICDVAIGCHVTRLSCSHRFHGDCIGKWLEKSRTCPLCRSKL